MPPKAARKTIKSNPLDRIVTKTSASKSKKLEIKKTQAPKSAKAITVKARLTPPKTLTTKGRKNMPNQENTSSNDLDPKVVSADQILTSEIASSATTPGAENIVVDYRHQLAKNTIRNASQWATAAGFIPVIGLDTVTISGVQLKMIYDLCEIYKVPFKKEAVLAVVGAALGGSVTTIVASKVANIGVSKIPYIGSVISLLSQPALSFATTYAIGSLFIEHFEKEGNLLNFDLESTKAVFDEQFEKAKAIYNEQLKNAKSIYTTQITKAKKLFSKNINSTAAAPAETSVA